MRWLFQSLSFRLVLTYLMLFLLSAGLLLGSYYFFTVRLPLENMKSLVRGENERLEYLYKTKGASALLQELKRRGAVSDKSKSFHAFIDPKGRVLTTNLPSWPATVSKDWLRIEADMFVDGDELDYEALVLDQRFPNGARLIIGRDIENISELEQSLVSAAYSMLGVAAVLGLVGGVLMSRAIGRRIDTVVRTARLVMDGDMSNRIPLQGSGDDFDDLAETLNVMLSRIEASVESVRRVSDSVAHELRTPLARLLANLEDLPNAEPESREPLLSSAIDEAGRLQNIFDAVLRISRIEAGRHTASIKLIDVSTLIRDALELYQPVAENREIVLSSTIVDDLLVHADPDLTFQVLANLLDNAIKYTPDGGQIDFSAFAAEGRISMVLTDNGPGIDPEHRDRVTERFYRIPSTAREAGAGLGLSLVSAVIALHQWKMILSSASPGLRVTISMPQASSKA